MADYRNEEAARRIIQCATCDGMVFAEFVGFGRADANSVCTFCGMTKTDVPFEGGDYFDVLMRSRSTGHVRQLRRAQQGSIPSQLRRDIKPKFPGQKFRRRTASANAFFVKLKQKSFSTCWKSVRPKSMPPLILCPDW